METIRKEQRTCSPDRTVTLTDYVDDYISNLQALGRSPATIARRRGDMMVLLDFLAENEIHDLRLVRAPDLEDYPVWLEQQDYKPNTVSGIITAVRGLFEHLVDRSVIFENPARHLQPPPVPFVLGLVLNEAQVQRLLDEPDCSRLTGQRDRTIIEVLYTTGMRLGECTGLTVNDIDLDQELLKVCGKGSKERLLPIGSAAATVLRVYVARTRPKLLARYPKTPALWISRVGDSLGEQSIRSAVKRHARSAGLPAGTDTHTLRRTCASHLLRNGASPMIVARILGHADLSTLSQYLKTSINDLQNAHARTAPGK